MFLDAGMTTPVQLNCNVENTLELGSQARITSVTISCLLWLRGWGGVSAMDDTYEDVWNVKEWALGYLDSGQHFTNITYGQRIVSLVVPSGASPNIPYLAGICISNFVTNCQSTFLSFSVPNFFVIQFLHSHLQLSFHLYFCSPMFYLHCITEYWKEPYVSWLAPFSKLQAQTE